MNYQKIYDDFIADRRKRESLLKHGYEKHHIRPRALGGGNDKNNIIKLSYRDHLFAHRMLAAIHGGYMITAFVFMLDYQRYSRKSRLRYEKARAARLSVLSLSQKIIQNQPGARETNSKRRVAYWEAWREKNPRLPKPTKYESMKGNKNSLGYKFTPEQCAARSIVSKMNWAKRKAANGTQQTP